MKPSQRFSTAILTVIGLSGLMFLTEAVYAASKPKPPPPSPPDPAIAYSVGTPSTGTWGDMMVVNADGSNQTVVVPGGATRPVSPSWSPDGRSLVYSHLFNGGCSGLHVVSMDQNGRWGTPQPLTVAGQCIFGWVPAWSPDDSSGTHTVVFTAIPDDQDTEAIFAVQFTRSLDGLISNVQGPDLIYRVSGVHETEPTWSPDGQRIAFIEADFQTSPADYDLLVLNMENPFNPPLSLVSPASPLNDIGIGSVSWAKTRDLLVVSADSDLWCVNINVASQTINLTQRFDQSEALRDEDPSWSSDDSQIIFSRGGVGMALTIDTTNGCPDSSAVANATLTQIVKAKGKNSLWGFNWRRN